MASRQNVSPVSLQQTPSQIASQGLPSEETDVNMLFEKYTVDEIRAIEKRTRQNIERKKEDLRVMVGERYRDLIEAADTISEMNTSSANVMNSIARMQTYCKDLSESHLVRGVGFNKNTTIMKKRKDTQFFSIAVQIKLLLDTPEKVWSAIDEGSFLRASQLYLLAKHVHTQLYTDPKLIARIDQLFPVLPRQWAAISHFKATILNGCRAALKNTNLSEKCICDSLCAIVLLEDSNPRQVFNEFLLARTNAVEHYFHPDQQISIKDQICEIVKLITNTVDQIYALFYDGHDLLEDYKLKEVNMVKQTLELVTRHDTVETLIKNGDSGSVVAHLPLSVRQFRPSVSASTLSIPQDQVQEKCKHWLESCSHGISTGIGKLLQYINTVKHLAAIRDDLWRLLAEGETGARWDERCHHVLNRTVNVWEDYFRQLFFNRTKTIIENHFNDAVNGVQQNLDKLLRDLDSNKESLRFERELSAYIWSESSGDVPPGSAWTVARTRSIHEAGGLLMKAKAYTNSSQSLCKEFDKRLQSLLEDSSHYTEPVDDDVTLTMRSSWTEAFDRCGDAVPVYQVIQDACDNSMNRLLDHVGKTLVNCRQELQTVSSSHSLQHKTAIDKALVCARLCCAVCELCPRLQECIVAPGEKDRVEAATLRLVRRSSSTTSKLHLKKSADDPRFLALKNRVLERSTDAYKLWTEFTAERGCRQFTECLTDNSHNAVLKYITRWDEIVIEEETEDGKTIHSTIRVPMQPSPYIHTLLYNVCVEINRIGGHSLRRSILEDLVEQMNQGIVGAYEQFVQEVTSSTPLNHQAALTQNRALQYIFDLRYIYTILARKGDSSGRTSLQSRTQAVLEDLETRIDPFDLDVFMPHVNSHLTKLGHRASVMYGALVSPDKLSAPPPARTSSTSQEQHNTLPLSSTQHRFTFLPVNSHHMRQSSNPVTTQVEAKISDVSGSLDKMTDKQSAGSFYNKIGSMGTIWFSNMSGTK